MHSSLIRGVVASGWLAFGCNAILGNDERSFVEDIGGGASGVGGTPSAGGNGGTAASGSGGSGGTSGGSNGTASGTGAAGAAGADYAETGGVVGSSTTATSSGAVGGSGGVTNSTAGGSGGTGVLCECMPGDTKSKQQACGNCGTATMTRVCGDDCLWGPFGELGECMNEGVCAPNDAGEELLHCDRGRWRYRRSTCGSDCQWGPWTETACEGADVCDGCACIAWCTDPNTGGTTCKWIGCSEQEARAECLTDLEAPEVDCTLKEPFTFKEWLPD